MKKAEMIEQGRKVAFPVIWVVLGGLIVLLVMYGASYVGEYRIMQNRTTAMWDAFGERTVQQIAAQRLQAQLQQQQAELERQRAELEAAKNKQSEMPEEEAKD